jgi:hypothetical protein
MSCERCGGFKVFDYFYGPLQCDGFRCVNCGAITDMRIVMPTQTRPAATARSRMRIGRRSLFAHAGLSHAGEAEHQP